jgi:hypothetical protein
MGVRRDAEKAFLVKLRPDVERVIQEQRDPTALQLRLRRAGMGRSGARRDDPGDRAGRQGGCASQGRFASKAT